MTTYAGLNPVILRKDGFTAIERTGAGLYQLTLEKGFRGGCSVGASFFDPETGQDLGGSIGYTFGRGGAPLIQVRDSSGKLSDEAPGFSVVYAC